MKSAYLIAGLIASAIALASGPGKAQETKPADGSKIVIGVSSRSAGALVPTLAQKEGLFEKYGVKNVEVTFGPGPQTSAILAGGAFTFTTTATPSVDLVALSSGRAKVLAVWQIHSGLSLLAAPGIESVKDLKGHKVAISGGKGSLTSMVIAATLRKEGLTLDDVTLIVLQDSGASTKAFLSSQVDAVASFQPNTSRLLEGRPGTKVIDDLNDIVLPGAQFSVNDAWAKEHPDLVVGVLRAIDEALQIYRKEPEKVKALIGEQLNLADNKPMVDLLYDDALHNFTERLIIVDEQMEKGIFDLLRLSGFAEATDDKVGNVIAVDYGKKALADK